MINVNDQFPSKIDGPKNNHFKRKLLYFKNDNGDIFHVPIVTDDKVVIDYRKTILRGTIIDIKEDHIVVDAGVKVDVIIKDIVNINHQYMF